MKTKRATPAGSIVNFNQTLIIINIQGRKIMIKILEMNHDFIVPIIDSYHYLI